MTYLDFWIFEIGHCIQKLREKNQNLFPITWNCNQLGASAPRKSSLKPPTDCNFMVLGVNFYFFRITFECNVRFQKFKSLNRSKFYQKSESLTAREGGFKPLSPPPQKINWHFSEIDLIKGLAKIVFIFQVNLKGKLQNISGKIRRFQLKNVWHYRYIHKQLLYI